MVSVGTEEGCLDVALFFHFSSFLYISLQQRPQMRTGSKLQPQGLGRFPFQIHEEQCSQ